MLTRLADTLGNGRLAIILLVVYLINQAGIGVILGEVRNDLLALQLSFTLERYQEIIRAWTPGMHDHFMNHFYLDFYHPFLYAAFLVSAIAYYLKKKDKLVSHRVLLALPLIAGGCDVLENFMHLFMHTEVLPTSGFWVFASSLAATTKWALAAFCVGTIALFFGHQVTRRDP